MLAGGPHETTLDLRGLRRSPPSEEAKSQVSEFVPLHWESVGPWPRDSTAVDTTRPFIVIGTGLQLFGGPKIFLVAMSADWHSAVKLGKNLAAWCIEGWYAIQKEGVYWRRSRN